SNASLGVPVCLDEQCLFRVSFLQNQLPVQAHGRTVAVILIGMAIILAILAVIFLIRKMETPEYRFLTLYSFLLALRHAMVALDFPAALLHSDLFNPQVFASSTLNASLGDLLLNEIALLILCLYLFKNYRSFKSLKFL